MLQQPTKETTMLTLLILVPVFFVVLILSLIVRLIAFPFRLLRPRHHYHRRFLGGSPYPGAYSRGFYPRPRFGGILSIVGLVALDRLFGRRW